MNKVYGMSDSSLCYGGEKSGGREGPRLERVQASLWGACMREELAYWPLWVPGWKDTLANEHTGESQAPKSHSR